MRWFRLYASLLNNRKFQQLSESLRARLLNLWCLAAEGDGVLPTLADIAFGLRLSEADAQETLRQLRESGFLEEGERGLMPHDWDSHQCVSDSSTGRVQRHRENKKRASSESGTPVKRDGNVSVTPQSREEKSREELNTPPYIPPRSAKGDRRRSGAAGIGLNTMPVEWGDIDLAADAELKRQLVEVRRVEGQPDPTDSPSSAESSDSGDPAGEFAWEFWLTYPKQGRKNQGAVHRLCQSILGPLSADERETLQLAIMEGLSVACASRDWTKDGGRWICSANTFLENKKWLDTWAPADQPQPDEGAAYIAAQYAAVHAED